MNGAVGMIQDMFHHQAWADAALLQAVRARPEAAIDDKLRATLYHIAAVQQLFMSLFQGRGVDPRNPPKPPDSLAAVERLFRDAQSEELSFVSSLQESDLDKLMQVPWFPGAGLTFAQGFLQVVLHSQNHRGQCLSRLAALGEKVPTLDFILWIKERPAPVWSSD